MKISFLDFPYSLVFTTSLLKISFPVERLKSTVVQYSSGFPPSEENPINSKCPF